jgi:hypothetical protein
MAYMAPSTAAAFTMFLSMASNLYTVLVLQDYFANAPQQRYLTFLIALIIITLSCILVYKKLTGEQRLAGGFNFVISMGPGLLAGYALGYLEAR